MNENASENERDPLDEPDVEALKDRLIRSALVAGMTYPEAADWARVSSRTVRRRMAQPEFRAEVRARTGERLTQQAARLSEMGEQALTVLAGLLDHKNPVIQERSARAILTLGHRFRREVELVDRIEALELRLDAALGRPRAEEDSLEVS